MHVVLWFCLRTHKNRTQKLHGLCIQFSYTVASYRNVVQECSLLQECGSLLQECSLLQQECGSLLQGYCYLLQDRHSPIAIKVVELCHNLDGDVAGESNDGSHNYHPHTSLKLR